MNITINTSIDFNIPAHLAENFQTWLLRGGDIAERVERISEHHDCPEDVLIAQYITQNFDRVLEDTFEAGRLTSVIIKEHILLAKKGYPFIGRGLMRDEFARVITQMIAAGASKWLHKQIENSYMLWFFSPNVRAVAEDMTQETTLTVDDILATFA